MTERLRPLEEGDYPAVCELVNRLWRQVYGGYVAPALLTEAGCEARSRELEADFRAGRLREYVYEKGDRVVAMCSFGDTADEDRAGAFELWRLYVSPEVQHGGVGRRLLAFAEEWAAAAGYDEAVIWAFQGNERAVAFYQRQGYRIDKTEALGEPYETTGVRLWKGLRDITVRED